MADDLAKQCRAAIRTLRAMPDDLKAELKTEVASKVAQPLAAQVHAKASGPHGPKVRIGVRPGAEPQLVAGGRAQVFSGGATGAQVFYGAEFGGGKSRTWYVTTSPRGHRFAVHRATTKQFVPARPFLFPTFVAEADTVTEAWLGILDPILDRWTNGQ